MSFSSRPAHRPAGLTALATVVALTLSGCGADGDASSGHFSENPGASDNAEFPMRGSGGSGDSDRDDSADAEKDLDKLKDLYGSVLDSLTVNDFRDPDAAVDLTGDFEYTVSDLNADDTPELLVKATGKEFSVVRVYGSSDDNTTKVVPAKIFHDGAASAGGSRMSVQTTSDNSGLLATSSQAGNGQTETVLWTFDGAEMTKSGRTWNYRIDQIPADLTATEQNIDWTVVDDRSALESAGAEETAAGGSGSGPLPQSATAPSTQIGGACGTVDGATITAVGSTSCGFAMAVGQQAMQPVYYKNGTGYAGSASVTATSPTNGQTYTMQCNIGSSGGTAVCSGGNNAQVRVSKEPTGLLALVN